MNNTAVRIDVGIQSTGEEGEKHIKSGLLSSLVVDLAVELLLER